MPVRLLRSAPLFAIMLTACCMASAQTRVVLIGTGGPELTPDRAGEATLIQAGGQNLLFDAGRGALDGLYRAHVPPDQVTRIFLTHLHSDHIEGLPGLWLTPWFLLGRQTPLEIWGPPGTKAMVDGMRAMFAHDLEHRPNPTAHRDWLNVTVHEIASGAIYSEGAVQVTALPVEHADGDPAFAYIVHTSDARILLTGDCTLSASLQQLHGPFDLVISNVAAGTPALEHTARLQPVFAKLMSPEQAALLFQKTQPRLAVYSHLVKKGLPGASGDQVLLRRTRAAGYTGPVRVGHDGDQILLGPHIQVGHPAPPTTDLDLPGATF